VQRLAQDVERGALMLAQVLRLQLYLEENR
jgi:hypothetical protein